jgi:hypothetical protein
MKLSRAISFLGCLLVVVASASAQDSLLGKKKGGGGSGGGSVSSPPPKQSSGDQKSGSRNGSGTGSNNSGSNSNRNSGGSSDNSDDRLIQGRHNTSVGPDNRQNQKTTSRSGRVHYGTVNNLLEKQDGQRKPISINNAPSRVDLDRASQSMRNQIRREDRPQVRDRDRDRDNDGDGRGYGNGNFRIGYYQYTRNFRDDYFCYPYYVFNPYQVTTCVVSPWYYYSFLPAYLDTSRLVFSSNYDAPFIGFPYDYQPDNRNRRSSYDDDRDARYDNSYVSRQALDFTIDDIVSAFMNSDRRAVDRLVPRYGNVLLGVNGDRAYGVRADDFYDMLIDVVSDARTVDYRILSVKSNDEEAEVVAYHDFLDSWGTRQGVYHRYHLFGERGHIVIRHFETSNNPDW